MSTHSNRSRHAGNAAMALSFLSTLMPLSAAAQQSGPTMSRVLEEVTVTARRREESSQSVPVSVTALSSLQLEEKGFQSMRDLTSLSPGLRAVSTGGGDTADISLRGLRRIPFSEAPAAVVPYFAEVPMPADGQLFAIADLESIQVLKGPQGTLFGRNTVGGAILLTPKKPVFGTEGYLTVGVGNYAYTQTEGALNLVLVPDKAALRIVGQAERRDGYIENHGVGGDLNDIDNQSYRVSLLLEPTEWLSNLTIYDYYEHKESGVSAVPVVNLHSGVAALSTQLLAGVCGNVIADTALCNYDEAFAAQQVRGLYDVKLDLKPHQEQKLWGLTNKTELALGDITVRNIFGYREVETAAALDSDGLALTLPILDAMRTANVSQVTEELQILGSAWGGRLDWMAGAFYLKSEPEGTNAGRYPVLEEPSWTNTFYERKNEALFGNIGYALSERLKLNVGYRVTWEEASACSSVDPTVTERPTVSLGDCLRDPAATRVDLDRTDNATWTVGLDYQLSDDLFLYAVSRRGVREGSFNLPDFTGSFFEPYQTFDQEKVTDLELGIKADWAVKDVTGRFNMSLYTMKHEDIQSSVNVGNLVSAYNNDPTQFGDPVGSTVPMPDATSIAINGGEARIDGVDLELLVLPTDRLTLSLTAAYTHTDVREQVPSPFPGYVDTPNLISPTPEWSTSVAMRYALPVAALQSELVLNASYYWSDSMLFGTDYMAPSYHIANLRMQMDNILGTGFGAAGYVNNVFDEEYYVSAAAASASLGFYSVNVGEPRMFGVEVSYRFGGN